MTDEAKGLWVDALESGARSVTLAERLLQRPWIFPLPIPTDEGTEEVGAGPVGEAEPQLFTEMVIIGVYWGAAAPDQPPVSLLLALPEVAAQGVADVVSMESPCFNQAGAEFGVAQVAVLVAAADYVGHHLAESVPTFATTTTFMEESAGLLPSAARLFTEVALPKTARGGAWLFMDEAGGVRLKWNGHVQGDIFFSASDASDEPGDLQQVIQPWLTEASQLLPVRRGAQSRRPSVVGLGSSARQLGAILARAGPKAKASAKTKSPTGRAQHGDDLLQQILGAVTAMSERVSVLEQRLPEAEYAGEADGGGGGQPPLSLLPSGPASVGSILAPPPKGGGLSYQAALAEARRLIEGPPLHKGGPPPRRVPSGLPGHLGGDGEDPAPRPARERRVDLDLRQAVAKGGADAQVAVNLAIIEALERVGHKGVSDEDIIGEFFAQDNPFDPETTKASASHGARSLAHLSRAVERMPEKWISQVDHAAARALGSDLNGLPWTMELYADRMLRFRNEHLERTWAFLAHLHGLSRRGEHLLLAARIGQFLKATELATQCNGSWKLAWALTSLPEVRSCAAGAVGKGLAMPAEYAATVAWLKDQQTLEAAVKKAEPEGKAKSPGFPPQAGSKQQDKGKHKKPSSEGVSHE